MKIQHTRREFVSICLRCNSEYSYFASKIQNQRKYCDDCQHEMKGEYRNRYKEAGKI